MTTIERETVAEVLDEMLRFWRESDEEYAEYYVDAVQSVRKNLLEETLEESPSSEHHPIQDEITILGPVGWWRWSYRVCIRDVGPYAGPSEWTVSLQRKKRGHWFTVDGLQGERTHLYKDGQEREGTLNDRTEPSESESELLAQLHRQFWGTDREVLDQ